MSPSEKRQILYVWNYREWGGAQIYFLSLMKAAKGKYAVSAMLPSDSDQKVLDYLESLKIPYEFLAPAPSSLGATGVFGRIRRRIDLYRSERSLVSRILGRTDLTDTIVHIDMGFWQSFRPLYRLAGRTNVFMTLHTALPSVGLLRALIWRSKGYLLSQRSRCRLMASNEDAKAGVRPYVPQKMFDSIEVAYSGFDPAEIEGAVESDNAVREKFGVATGIPLIVTCGQFIARKGCWTVLESLNRLRGTGVDFMFLWLATSLPDTAIVRRIVEYGLGDAFRLLTPDEIGPTRSDLLRTVAAADIFVLASTQEGLPISLVEAMALGRPCIATRVGAIPEALTNGEDGLLIEGSEPDELAAAIIDLINDKAKRERLGAAAAKTARASFNAVHSAEKVINIYDSIWQTG